MNGKTAFYASVVTIAAIIGAAIVGATVEDPKATVIIAGIFTATATAVGHLFNQQKIGDAIKKVEMVDKKAEVVISETKMAKCKMKDERDAALEEAHVARQETSEVVAAVVDKLTEPCPPMPGDKPPEKH